MKERTEDFYKWLLKYCNIYKGFNFFGLIRQYCTNELGVLLYGIGGSENKEGYLWVYKNGVWLKK
jgi:hypothetical protein